MRDTTKISREPPYADTDVPYEKTKAQIELILKSYGIKGLRWTSMEGEDDVLEFIVVADIHGVKKQIGIAVKPPHIYIKKRSPGRGIVNTENINQEYRLLFYWIKSKIEAVMWGLSTIEKEFLSEVTMKLPDGRTTSVGEIVMNLVSENRLQSLPFIDQQKTTPKAKENVIDV